MTQYPSGKLRDDDEGAMRLAVILKDNRGFRQVNSLDWF